MPLSADRCQVTWGPNPLKRLEVDMGGMCGSIYKCVHLNGTRQMLQSFIFKPSYYMWELINTNCIV